VYVRRRVEGRRGGKRGGKGRQRCGGWRGKRSKVNFRSV
jgi:hypothetical protein